jgi:hypothetical protein
MWFDGSFLLEVSPGAVAAADPLVPDFCRAAVVAIAPDAESGVLDAPDSLAPDPLLLFSFELHAAAANVTSGTNTTARNVMVFIGVEDCCRVTWPNRSNGQKPARAKTVPPIVGTLRASKINSISAPSVLTTATA